MKIKRIERIERKKVWEEVAEKLQEAILTGHWKVGDRLPSEVELANAFGVSRSSLREALRQLGSMGLIEMRQGEGNYVSSPNLEELLSPLGFALIGEREDLLAIMEVRRMIEVGTAGLAAVRASDDELRRLESLFECMICSKDDLALFAQADHMFHRQIALCTKNRVIIKIFDAIDVLLVNQQLEIVTYEGARERGINDHKKILQAIISGDAQQASEIMRKHMDNTYNAIVQTFDSCQLRGLEE